MVDLRDIHSVTDFQRNAKEYIGKLKKSKSPMVLTVNGHAELVVQDAASYQEMVNHLDELEVVAAIQVGLEEAKAGKGRPAVEALEELGRKHGLRRRSHAGSTR